MCYLNMSALFELIFCASNLVWMVANLIRHQKLDTDMSNILEDLRQCQLEREEIEVQRKFIEERERFLRLARKGF